MLVYRAIESSLSMVMAMISSIFFTQFFDYYHDIVSLENHYFQENINYFRILFGGI